MKFPPWQVASWTRCFVQLDEFQRLSSGMRQVACTGGASASGLLAGQCLWGLEFRGAPIGVAWDWGEALPGVPALCDPMSLISNIDLVDSEGLCLSHDEALLHLNQVVQSLEWQRGALATIGAVANMPPAPRQRPAAMARSNAHLRSAPARHEGRRTRTKSPAAALVAA